jgi:patatin-like phospholipase/acyl hydrolase
MGEAERTALFRVLTLDGGGAKGFYTLGVLKGIEGMLGRPIHEGFDLIYGTSTGSITAALLALGHSVDEVHQLYKDHVLKVMSRWLPWSKSAALRELAEEVFKGQKFDAFKTHVGIVATRWAFETPLIFKTSVAQAHGDHPNFVPGFGCTVGDAVEASCSAFPFFCKKTVVTSAGEGIIGVDGGFCANNPALYAIVDATEGFKIARQNIRLVTIGVGEYPAPKRYFSFSYWIGYWFTVRLPQRVLEINTKSMEQLRAVLFKEIPTVRISNTYREPAMATDLFEADRDKLDQLYQRGRQSFREYENALRALLK